MNFDTAIDQGDRARQEDAIAVLPLADGSLAAAVCDGLGGHPGSEHAATAAAWAWATTAALTAPRWRDDAPAIRHVDAMANAADEAARLGKSWRAAPEDPRTCIGAVLVGPMTDESPEVFGWAVGDVLVTHVGIDGKAKTVSEAHRLGRHHVARCLPTKEVYAVRGTVGNRRDLVSPWHLGQLRPGEMLIIATDGIWCGHPQRARDEQEAAAWLAEKARIAFERAKPAPAAEIMTASKAELGGEPMWKRDNAAVVVIWREMPHNPSAESDDDRPF